MLQMILGITIAFFAIIGIADLAHGTEEFLLKPRGKRVAYIVSSHGHDEQIEYIVRSLAIRAVPGQPLIVVMDDGMDEETKKICELLRNDLGCVTICTKAEIPALLGGDFQSS